MRAVVLGPSEQVRARRIGHALRQIGQRCRVELVDLIGQIRVGQLVLVGEVAELSHVLGDDVEVEIDVALRADTRDFASFAVGYHSRVHVLRASASNPGEELLHLGSRLGHEERHSELVPKMESYFNQQWRQEDEQRSFRYLPGERGTWVTP